MTVYSYDDTESTNPNNIGWYTAKFPKQPEITFWENQDGRHDNSNYFAGGKLTKRVISGIRH